MHKFQIIDSCNNGEEKDDEENRFDESRRYLEDFLGENLIGCGELKFNQFDVEPTKFIIVKNQIEQEFIGNLKKCLFNKIGLNLPKPKFLLSVTGGAKTFTVDTEIIQAFKSALIKVASNTQALIVSGGLDVGVMSEVGNAVKEDLYGGNQPVLGIASWRRSKLQHKDKGVDKKEEFLRDLKRSKPNYENENPKFFERENEIFLNSKHSGFIFVDNDHTGKLRGEMKFRAELEHSIAEELNIPLILVALQGGIGTLETICHMIEKKHHVLLIDKTGGCAELVKQLLDVLNHLKYRENDGENANDEQYIYDIIEGLLNEQKYQYLIETPAKKQNVRCYLRLISEQRHELINIFEITGFETKENIEDQILKALTKVDPTGNRNENQYICYKISLAITWNQLDKAKEDLARLSVENSSQLNSLFIQALLENKPEFLAMFIQKKMCIESFLTKDLLHRLYNNDWRNSKRPHNEPFNFYLQKINDNNGEISFENVHDFLKQNFDTLNVDSFLPKDEFLSNYECKKPFLNLFIWSVLSNRISSAKLFWKLGNNQICNALIASKILKYFSNMSNSTEHKTLFVELANEFEQLAIGVLNIFEENTREYVNDVLVIRYLEFIRMDCLQLAVEAECEDFLAHRVVQNALEKIWSSTKVCNYNTEKLSKYEKSLIYCQNQYNNTRQYIFGSGYLSFRQSNPIYDFFTTPRIKFALHTVSYLAFLFLFTITMLFKDLFITENAKFNDTDEINNTNSTESQQFDHNSFPLSELCLLIWILTLIIDEFRQLFFNNYPRYSFRIKFKKYVNQEWNLLDFIGCAIFIIGFILICFRNEDFYQLGRILLSIDLAIWYIRILQSFFVLRRLGPKILMIRKMVTELTYFFLIITVYVVAFGVSFQAILSPRKKFQFSVFSEILNKAYWPLYGEISLLEVLNDDTCGKDPENPCLDSMKFTITYILLMVYMIISSVLLINLLIAMFTTVFEKIQDKSDMIWKNQRYIFISDYVDLPFLPPPFNIFAYIWYIIDLKERYKEEISRGSIDQEDDVLKELERNCAKKVLNENPEYKNVEVKFQERSLIKSDNDIAGQSLDNQNLAKKRPNPYEYQY